MTTQDGGPTHRHGARDGHGGMTDPDYWDATWNSIQLPQRVSFEHLVNRRWDDLFSSYLTRGHERTVVEVGCAPGAWLIYFHDRWEMAATGIESSPLGAELTRRNAAMTKTPIHVIEGDLFDRSISGQFDLVLSSGLVEHFEDLSIPLARLRDLVAPGGLLITSVPNLDRSLYAYLTRRINPAVLAVHLIVSPADLAEAYRKVDIKLEKVGYFGTWNLEVVNFGPHHRLQTWANRIDRGAGRVLGAMNARGESRRFSPYVVAVGRAPSLRPAGRPVVGGEMNGAESRRPPKIGTGPP